MKLNELRNLRSEILAEAQKLMTGDNITAETRTKFDGLMASADQHAEDIKRLERVEAIESEQRSAAKPPRSNPGAEIATGEEKEQRDALRNYIRTGETRDLTVGANGVIVPTGFADTLTEARKSWGQIAAAVKNWNTPTGEPMRVPLSNDTASMFTVLGEAQPVTELDPTFTGITSQVDKFQSGLVKVSREILQDSAFDLDGFLRNEFGKRYFRGIASAVSNGTTSNNVQAIGSVSGATYTAPAGGDTSISYADFVALYGMLEHAYLDGASWVMNSRTKATLNGLTDNYGRPLLVNPNAGQLQTILGLPIVINQFAPDLAANAVSVLLGNLPEAYTLRIAGGVEILRLNERYADTGEVGFIGFARIGGFGTDAGTHPLISFKNSPAAS